MKHTLAYYDGWLCVVYQDTEWSNPVRVRHWWPVAKMSKQDIKYRGLRLGIEVWTHGYEGCYSQSKGIGLGHVNIRLKDGGKTQPIHTEREDIPAPKTRVETRYQDGHWQKYLKSKGWVTA